MKKIIPYVLSIVSILLLWQLLSININSDLILPSPLKVLIVLLYDFKNINFWNAISFTYIRVSYAFFITILTGFAIGLLSGKNEFFKRFFEIPVSVIRCTPVVVIILSSLFWFSSNTVPVFVAVLMALPVMIVSVQTGFSYIDDNLLMMAETFNLSKIQKFKYISVPSILPAALKGSEQVLGLCWKVVVAGEVLSLPRYGIGTTMQYNQVHIETLQVMSLGLGLIIISFIIQKLYSLFIKYLLKVVL